MKWYRKLRMRLSLLNKPKDSAIYCDPSGDFYAIYDNDLKRWVLKDGDYCQLKNKN